MTPASNHSREDLGSEAASNRRALVVRIGALGDVLLTRRLTYSLSLAGFRSTLLAPARHALLLLADPWIEAVLDSEAPALAPAFEGVWPGQSGAFDLACVISRQEGLVIAAHQAAAVVVSVSPTPLREDAPIWAQWAEATSEITSLFRGALPALRPKAADAVLSGASLIHPGSGSTAKNWPVEKFLALSRQLQGLGHRVVWIRGPAEVGQPDAWDGERIDRPSLQTLAAILAVSRIFIGNDSGVSHLAGATGTSLVVLFGPTNPTVWRPDGPRVQVVRAASGALEDISVESVVMAADHEPQSPGST